MTEIKTEEFNQRSSNATLFSAHFEKAVSLARQAELVLRIDEGICVLEDKNMQLKLDFRKLIPRLAPNKLSQELLVRAAHLKSKNIHSLKPLAIDATAGLGEDSLLLAASGFRVKLYERNPVVAVLLADALKRAAQIPELAEIVENMELQVQDSCDALAQLKQRPDLVYLDPMFPARKKSASVKKKFQLLQKLERPCEEAEALLKAAIASHPHKVIVKRPLKGDFLAAMQVSYSVEGKTVRYDVLNLP